MLGSWRKSRTTLAAMLVLASAGMAVMASPARGDDGNDCRSATKSPYAITTRALTGPADTELTLRLTAAPGCAAATAVKHLQIKTYDENGNLADVLNLKDVPAPNGVATVNARPPGAWAAHRRARTGADVSNLRARRQRHVAATARPDRDHRQRAAADADDPARRRRRRRRRGQRGHRCRRAGHPRQCNRAARRPDRRERARGRQRLSHVPAGRPVERGHPRA